MNRLDFMNRWVEGKDLCGFHTCPHAPLVMHNTNSVNKYHLLDIHDALGTLKLYSYSSK